MTTAPITLYYAPRTRAERVKRLLDAFAIPYQLVTLDYDAGEQKAEAYVRDVHPLGRVPAVRVGEQVILESGAICLQLADLFPEKGMAPPVGSPERGRYYEWFFLFHTTIEPLVLAAGEPDSADRAEAELRQVMTALAPRLGRPYLLGEQFTAADVMVHTELFWQKILGIYPSDLPDLEAYYQRVENRLAGTGV